MPTYLEKELAEVIVKFEAEEYKWKILPSHHPQSIRVHKIGQDIIRALLKELKKEEENRRIARFDEFKWEFIVVDEPTTVNAVYTPGGKIVVYTGLLDYFKTDAEIAALIGHEVGHAAGRHGEETVSRFLWLMLLMSFVPDFVEKMANLYVWWPVSWRHEIEADYIRLLLMAAAGYDPRVAVEVCEKFDQLNCTSPLDDEDHLSTHPSEKKRAQLLYEPKVLEEALSLYREALKEKKAEAEKETEGEGDHAMGHMSFFSRLIGVFEKS